ncbi:hypothetical protein ACA910_000877 [Epithemia clementina (nom. ined.)]
MLPKTKLSKTVFQAEGGKATRSKPRYELLKVALFCLALVQITKLLKIVIVVDNRQSQVNTLGEVINQFPTSTTVFLANSTTITIPASGNNFGEQTESNNLNPQGQTWQNKFELVHVVHTRFMQRQPNLKHLGQARMGLFRAITFPCLKHQTTSEFLWIIRTDPDLDPSMLDDLRREVRQVPNAVLVGSNENENDIRHDVDDITKPSVLEGSYDLVMSYHAAAQSHPVLETRLDADDALSVHFIESIQTRAAAQLIYSPQQQQQQQPNRPSARQPTWMILCPFDALEWHLYNPWDKTSDEGLIKFANKRTCITPGLTFVYHVHVTKESLPTRVHDVISKVIPACKSNDDDKCLHSIDHDLDTTILRARTPTSAGMHRVITDSTSVSLAQEEIAQFVQFHQDSWSDLKSRFAIDIDLLKQLRSDVLGDLPAIIDDNIKGQCTRFHSCKESTKEELKQLLSGDKAQTTEFKQHFKK